jgi:type IV pilus assembly protein PilV
MYSLRPRGFTLIEVLVAIVVLSFGVLGVVGMQVAALQSNREARNQSVAVALGRELGDMMRSNKDIALLTAANPYLIDFSGDVPDYAVNCYTNTCSTTTQVAEFNVAEWLARVQAALPGARVVVCYDAAPYHTTSGRPQWGCTAGTGAPAVVKIGWTQKKLNSSEPTLDLANTGADSARPIVILPLIAGSTT